MKGKIKVFLDKPMTWGGYFKVGAIATVASLAITGLSLLAITINDEVNAKKYVEINKEETV